MDEQKVSLQDPFGTRPNVFHSLRPRVMMNFCHSLCRVFFFQHFSFMTRTNSRDKAEMINGQFIRDILMTLHTVELAKIMKAENNVSKDGWTACVTQTGKHYAFETAEVSFGE